MSARSLGAGPPRRSAAGRPPRHGEPVFDPARSHAPPPFADSASYDALSVQYGAAVASHAAALEAARISTHSEAELERARVAASGEAAHAHAVAVERGRLAAAGLLPSFEYCNMERDGPR